jgi:RNA polymerase sigma-70 factor (ECF subfamily)
MPAVSEAIARYAGASGDGATRFRALFDANYDFVWRMLRRLGVAKAGADDAAQDVFVIAARRLHDIELGKERSFVLGTAIRRAAELRRANHRVELLASDEALDRMADIAAPPDEVLDERRALALLDLVLESLDEDLRAVLVLFELEGLTKGEIAEALGIPEGTVASRMRRARARFMEHAARVKAARSRMRGPR